MTELPCHTLSTQKHRSPRVPTATPGTPLAPRVQATPMVQPISTEEIPSNHQPIAQRLRSQSEPKPLEPATVIEQSVSHRTRYLTTQKYLRVKPVLAAQSNYPAKPINLWCTPRPEEHTEITVLDNKNAELM